MTAVDRDALEPILRDVFGYDAFRGGQREAVEAVLREFAEVVEYRVEIDARSAMTQMRVEVEPMPGCADPVALARDVEEALRTAFHLRVPVSAVAPGTLPRFELKARRWIRDPCSST